MSTRRPRRRSETKWRRLPVTRRLGARRRGDRADFGIVDPPSGDAVRRRLGEERRAPLRRQVVNGEAGEDLLFDQPVGIATASGDTPRGAVSRRRRARGNSARRSSGPLDLSSGDAIEKRDRSDRARRRNRSVQRGARWCRRRSDRSSDRRGRIRRASGPRRSRPPVALLVDPRGRVDLRQPGLGRRRLREPAPAHAPQRRRRDPPHQPHAELVDAGRRAPSRARSPPAPARQPE